MYACMSIAMYCNYAYMINKYIYLLCMLNYHIAIQYILAITNVYSITILEYIHS